MCVVDSTIATRPARLPPQMKAADHHLHRIDQTVMQPRKLTRPETTCPMRFFQSASEARWIVNDPGDCEAVLEVTRQEGTVLQVFDRLSLCVHSLCFDDVIAMRQEELDQFDVCLKRHLARARSGWSLFWRRTDEKSTVSSLCRAGNREDALDRGAIAWILGTRPRREFGPGECSSL